MRSLPPGLEEAWNEAQPRLAQIKAALTSAYPGHPRIIRVCQLDSELLDQELAHLLEEPIKKSISLISSSFRTRCEPELSLFIQLTLYKLSMWKSGASYGAKLQDLRYVVPGTLNSSTASGLPRNILLVHGALTLVLPYLRDRLRTHALSRAWPDAPLSDHRRKIWNVLVSVESAYGLLGLANFVAFLWDGRYRTLADRLLRMSLVPSRRLVKRDVSYEFMNRQMVWHAFTEFLLFLLPLLSARIIRRRVYHIASVASSVFLYPLHSFRSAPKLQSSARKAPEAPTRRGKFWSLPDNECAICLENARFNLNVSEPTNLFTSLAASSSIRASTEPPDSEMPTHPICNPYQTTCGHIYCYHCIAERIILTADDAGDDVGWECLRCGEEVHGVHRFAVEIIESEMTESDYEFSSDPDVGTDLSGSMGSYSESGFSE